MIEQFYVLQIPIAKPFEASTDYFEAKGTRRGEALLCPSCKKPLSMLTWLPPFKVELKCWGRFHADIAFGGPDLLISHALRDAFHQEGLTGVDFLGQAEVVKVVPKKMTESAPRYWVGRIKWGSAVFDDAASEAEYDHPWSCAKCRVGDNLLRFKRMAFESNSWGGEDIFYPRRLGPGCQIVSKRFREMFERHKYRGVLFTPAENYSVDFDRQEN